MKKLLVLAGTMIFALSAAGYADTNVKTTPLKTPVLNSNRPDVKIPPAPKGQNFQKRHAEFENRLKLTEEQKRKADELHKQGFEKMRPIMEKMKEKQKEAYSLKDKTDEKSIQKREDLENQIKALRLEARNIRKQNMSDFEQLLDKNQKKELDKMKKEGRKNFEKNFKGRPMPKFGQAEIPPQPPKRNAAE